MNDMPHEPESEIGVLGSVLMADNKSAQDAVIGKLDSEHFWVRSHKLIWEQICQMILENAPVDVSTITSRLRDNGRLDEVGGIHGITQLALSQPTSAHIDYFIDRLIEKKRLRDLIETSTKIIADAKQNKSSFEIIDGLESNIDAMTKNGELAFQNQHQAGHDDLEVGIQLRKSGKKDFGIPSGIKSFDDAFFGLKPAQYYVIAGKPSAGKTSFADQITMNLLRRHIPVLYIGLESDRARIIGKLSAKFAQVNFFNYSRGQLSDKEYGELERASKALRKLPLQLITPPDLQGHQIRSLMRKAARRDKCQVVILDYIQHISMGKDDDERLAIAKASLQIQRGCIETGMSAIVLSQFNRIGAESERPTMSQLKGSGQLEQDADNIVLLWAEVAKHTLAAGELLPVVMTIEKNKDGPNGIDQKLFFDGPMMTFKERTLEREAAPERYH